MDGDRPWPVFLMALSGIAGFYIGKNQTAMEQPPALAAATPQQHAQQLPKGVTRLPVKAFGNWNLNCFENVQKQRNCELVLRAVSQMRKELVLSLAVVRKPKGDPLLIVVTPPSVTLPAGVELAPDASPGVLKASFAACGPGACKAEIGLTDAVVTVMRGHPLCKFPMLAAPGARSATNCPMRDSARAMRGWRVNRRWTHGRKPCPCLATTKQSPQPLFYNKPQLLTAEAHGKLALNDKANFAFAAKAISIPINAVEVPVARSYPIVFASVAPYIPLAVVGLRRDENLFVDAKGVWDPAAYIPAYVRRHPFALAESGAKDQFALCIMSNPCVWARRAAPAVQGRQAHRAGAPGVEFLRRF